MRRIWIAALLALTAAGCGFLAQEPQAPVPVAPEASATAASPAPLEETAAPTAEAAEPVEPLRVANPPDPASAAWQEVMGGLNKPLDLTHAGDERIFIVEQPGTIQVIQADGGQPALFLDIRDRVGSKGNEQGLLGLAFHPDFAANGFFYVNYTDRNGDTVIARFRAEGNQADPGSEFVLLRIAQPYSNHNGGGLAFGPDGYLYIGTGDGGSGGDPEGNGQNLGVLLGKMLRIDVDGGEPYAIPPDNPFAGGGARPEIWAYGLRNPWRYSFDAATGDLYIADVGQNLWEEINLQPAASPGGENYGWAILEGSHPFNGEPIEGLTNPIAEYDHGEGCSVTGGYVVRDSRLPAWNGVYLYGDYCSGTIWGLLPDGQGGSVTQPLFESGARISSFGLDSQGRVYLVDHSGAVYRLDPAS